jgi:hypothetical protein
LIILEPASGKCCFGGKNGRLSRPITLEVPFFCSI